MSTDRLSVAVITRVDTGLWWGGHDSPSVVGVTLTMEGPGGWSQGVTVRREANVVHLLESVAPKGLATLVGQIAYDVTRRNGQIVGMTVGSSRWDALPDEAAKT